jgi:1,4-dihydroxy-2-naphthoate octaprenyltransferase
MRFKSLNPWFLGARPKTLPAAIVPVLVGTSSAHKDLPGDSINWWLALCALMVAMFLQIGVNFANDYSDGIRGTDKNRIGPTRLVESGLAKPEAVRFAAFLYFFLAAVFGLVIAFNTTFWFLLVGAFSILAAWGYTGGKNPYGYRGLGEVSVFLFFGLVATYGSYSIQNMKFSIFALLVSIPIGLLACALLAINNLRDLNNDAKSDKKTLAVRLGEKRAKDFYVYLLITAHIFAGLVAPITLILGIRTLQMVKDVRSKSYKDRLMTLLADTARLQLLFGVIMSVTIFFSK